MFAMISIGMANVTATNANLLVALAVLLREGSVTAAAARMGITQSAMSGTLAQLRTLFDDPLLVRVGRAMQPTPRALALAQPLQRAVAAFDEALALPTRFDPASSEARFAIALDDRSEMLIVPELMRRIRASAPGVSVQVHAWGRHRPPPGLANGELDVVLGLFAPGRPMSPAALKRMRGAWPSSAIEPIPPGHHIEPLFELAITSIVRADHPRVGKTLDLDTFCALDHVLVTEETWARGIIDDALARMGRTRRLAARVPHLLAVGRIVAMTDLCATIDARFAWLHAQTLPLRMLESPVQMPAASLALVWHERTDRDPARQWLRDELRAAAASSAETGPRPVRGRRAGRAR